MDDTRVTSSVGPSLTPKLNSSNPSPAVNDERGTHQSSQTSVGQKSGLRLDWGAVGNQALERLADLLPTQVLSSAALTRAEWAWRQLLLQQFLENAAAPKQTPVSADDETVPKTDSRTFTETAPGMASSQVKEEVSTSTSLAQTTMDVWWKSIGDWLKAAQQTSRHRAWQGSLPQRSVVSLSQLSTGDLQRMPAGQRAEVLLDRLLASVTADNGLKSGSGLFVPSGVQQSENRPTTVIRWHAQRQTRMSRHGQLVYRLSIQLQLQDWPVEITLLSMKPSLQVHIRTNHPVLSTRVSAPDAQVVKQLAQAGWSVDRWSYSPMSESEG